MSDGRADGLVDGGIVARRIVVRGRVQGVGFRDWTVATARAAGVAGWVRNRPDGSVEIHAEGAAAAVAAFVEAAHHGPPAARVDAAMATDAACERPDGFTRRVTG